MSPLSDDELIERARKHVPVVARAQRYASRNQDVNDNWDLTRALLRRIDRLEGNLKWAKTKNVVYFALLGGAAAKGIEVAALAVVRIFFP